MIVQMKVPEVGESIQEVEIAQWLKQEGQWVEQDEDVVEVDSEKASLPIPAPTAGRIVKILKRDGDTAEVGEVIAEIDDAAQPEQSDVIEEQPVFEHRLPDEPQAVAVKSSPQSETDPAKTATSADATAARPTVSGKTKAARRVSESVGADTSLADTSSYIATQETQRESTASASTKHVTPSLLLYESEQAKPEEEQMRPAVQTAAVACEEEILPMSMIRRRIAARLVAAQQNSALLTTFNEIDMSAVIKLRLELREPFQEQYGVKLGFMSFFVKAAIEALKRFPEVNAEVRGNDVVFRNYYDIGIAIGGGKGLVVPVLRNADQLSFAEVESAIDDFANRAVSNTLRLEELTGGTFTISNGGIYGSLLSTPIVNPPQSGVLGMHAIQDRPVAREGQVVIRPMMYVALTYDHRIVDGREGVGFLRRIKDLVEQPSRILLEV